MAELEHGWQPLDHASRARLALVFGVPPEQLAVVRTPLPSSAIGWAKRGAFLLIAALIGLLLLLAPLPRQQHAAQAAGKPTPTASQPHTSRPAAALPRPTAPQQPANPPATSPPATSPPPTPTPRFVLAADGPHGCPLDAANNRVVITQGYGEGSHAPSNVWGAVDLGIDGDGDGNAEPAATQGAPVAATIGGVAHVYMGSWPGGNYVRITDVHSGWSAAYAHLDSVAVADGQAINAGMPIGSAGSTGMASGPHLHYEVWHGDTNVDPTGLIECQYMTTDH